jgi:hypothetical protein
MMVGDWVAVASSLLDSMARHDPLPVDRVGDLLTAAAVLSAVGQRSDAVYAFAAAQRLATRIETDISEAEAPLRAHLAGLQAEAEAALTAVPAEAGLTVPPAVLEALRRVAEPPHR